MYVQQLLICLQCLSVSKPWLVEVALASKQADSRLQSIAVVKAAGAERCSSCDHDTVGTIKTKDSKSNAGAQFGDADRQLLRPRTSRWCDRHRFHTAVR